MRSKRFPYVYRVRSELAAEPGRPDLVNAGNRQPVPFFLQAIAGGQFAKLFVHLPTNSFQNGGKLKTFRELKWKFGLLRGPFRLTPALNDPSNIRISKLHG